MTKNLAILASGSGTNAENIAKYFVNNDAVSVKIIISNNADAYVHERAKQLGIPSVTISRKDVMNTDALLRVLESYKIDFVVLAGYLVRIPDNVTEKYNHKMVNIHPSLLPKFGGKGMYGNRVHEAVIEAKEKESGITIHYTNDKYDEGEVIFQAKCEVKPDDTPDSLAHRIHALEYEYYPRVIEETLMKE